MQPLTRRRTGALLVVGAMLLSVALVVVDGLRFSRAPEPTVPPPVTLQALLEQGSQERHAVYAFLRDEAPGARIVLDTTGPSPGLDTTSLRSLGAAGPIEQAPIGDGPLGSAWLPEDEPDVRGRLRFDAWELHREPGAIDTVLVGSRDGRTVLVDRRSVPGLGIPAARAGDAAPAAPSLLHAVTVEAALLVGLILMGGLALPRRVGGGIMRVALALLAGAAVQATSAFLFLGGRVAMLGGLAVALVVARSLRRRGITTGWTVTDLPVLGSSALALACAALIARLEGTVIVTADALAHVERAIALGSGTMGLADLDAKRPLALAAIQAPAHALGAEGLHAFGWALLLAATIVLAMLPLRLLPAEDRVGRIGARAAGGLAFALILSVPMLRTMAAFLNTHLLVAGLLLLLVSLWALDGTARIGLEPLGAIGVIALIPARTESVLLVGLVLLATLAACGDVPTWRWAWPVVGTGLAVWNGFHVIAALDAGSSPSFPVAALVVVGVLIVLVGPFLHRSPPQVRRATAVAGMVSLWALLLLLLTSTVGSGSGAVEGLRVNLGQGEGAWGVLSPLLVVLTVILLVARSVRPDPRLLLMRWLVVGAVPSVVLAKAADGTDGVAVDSLSAALDTLLVVGARVGSWGDSTNRMWSHFVLVAVALVVTTAVLAMSGDEVRTPPHASRARHVRAVAAVLAGGVMIAVTLTAWMPTYLGPSSPGSTRVILAVPGPGETVIGPELTEGIRVEKQVRIPRVVLPDDASDITVCATFRTTDLGRIVTGTTGIGLGGPSGASSRAFDEFAWSGERVDEVCLPDPGVGRAPMTYTVWAEGGASATRGDAAVLLTRADGSPTDAIEVRYVAASEDPRGAPIRLASTLLRRGIDVGPLAVAVLLALGLMLSRSQSAPR